MNLISLGIIAIAGTILWVRSGVRPTQRWFLVGLVIMVALWWGIWGQVAVGDGWWVYGPNSVTVAFLGTIPLPDLVYFFSGLGWYLYSCRKLHLF
jgi:lycopene cyclase domain-containing protein